MESRTSAALLIHSVKYLYELDGFRLGRDGNSSTYSPLSISLAFYTAPSYIMCGQSLSRVLWRDWSFSRSRLYWLAVRIHECKTLILKHDVLVFGLL